MAPLTELQKISYSGALRFFDVCVNKKNFKFNFYVVL
jgi:hypothetical protein